jgi:hypothetical protein
MIASLERTLGIDQHVGDVLDVPNFPDTAPSLQ